MIPKRSLGWAALACASFAFVAVGCDEHAFSKDVSLGGKVVSAETLNRGKTHYMVYCQSCHGEKGDGKGWAAKGLIPPPRNFTAENVVFKFGSARAGQLPSDDDFKRILKYGLHGTAMLQWDVSDPRLDPILQYIKTFSPRWADDAPGDPIPKNPDPYGTAKAGDAIKLGKKLYHTKINCNQCHPSYASKDEIETFSQEVQKRPATFRPDMYFSKITDSPDFETKILPPDFTYQPLRSVRPDSQKDDLYRVIGAGIGGAAMPSWVDVLTPEELWAIVYYVDSLIPLANDPAKRKAFWEPLRGGPK